MLSCPAAQQQQSQIFLQHTDATGCPVCLCGKFEINLRSFTIRVVMLKYITAVNYNTLLSDCPAIYLKKESSVIPHSILMQLEACLICTKNFKLI